MVTEKKPYLKPEFVEFGRIEDITRTKTWYTSNDWLGNIIDQFVPGDQTDILGGDKNSFS